jgi:hypothetical protein
MLLERAEQLGKYHAPVLGGYAKSHPQTIDTAQTRHAMRTLGIGKITVTPTPDGWRFEGDGSLAGMVHSGSVRAPQSPHARQRPGVAVALLDFASRSRGASTGSHSF